MVSVGMLYSRRDHVKTPTKYNGLSDSERPFFFAAMHTPLQQSLEYVFGKRELIC